MKKTDNAPPISIGLNFKTQLFGGYDKADVNAYIESAITSIEDEKEKFEKKKNSISDLLVNGQMFGDQLITDAQIKATSIIDEANVKAQEIIKSANHEVLTMKKEKEDTYKQYQSNFNNLIHQLTETYKNSCAEYEKMLEDLKQLESVFKEKNHEEDSSIDA
ncbi:MAG: DivIVA domain-containing protein [Oscillospiraceae bacterium]